ncbi:dienelactone hydrolase family protein [Sulfurospirillum diekertiae]|uniref:Hydrolase n=1 Tax=Sulfurospirillum diekertiae TaxID=1854492 RepID=A0A290HPH5_9BACT|nr:dienelactone hydrolase family protein [Sulfurospirillum diekertiae]ATB68534.1 putative hydrolase [Sulfurospirillum diekertiae]QIR76380.1 dienelactone hydrolase family protein [Sulfurospirillum diekertiae]QIR79006.1 dienelactone hydrolase family protein [Sulfurospirillum diekertiae]
MKTFVAFFMLFMCATLSFAKEGFVTYVVDGKTYEGYYTTPSDEAPLVFIVHDWDGLNEYEMTRAKMLNALGYGAFAIDLFGQGVKPVTIEEKKALTNALYNDRAKMRKLLDAGYQAAKKEGANVSNAIGIGYCFGGAALLEMARMGTPLKGFAIFHGGLATPAGEDYTQTKGFILVLHGSADESVSLDEFTGLAKELEKTGIKHEMITYSGAPHAFSVFGTDRYREDADKKSWRRLVEFLGEMLSK